MPKWLAALFTALLLCFALFLAWQVYDGARLSFRIADTQVKLDTSRGREAKQQREYDEAAAELPLAHATLTDIEPRAAAAAEAEQDARDRRKAAREASRELGAQADAAEASAAEAPGALALSREALAAAEATATDLLQEALPLLDTLPAAVDSDGSSL